MRTTVTLDDDVAAAVRKEREARRLGVSEAVNDLIRAGLATAERPRKPFVQRTASLGIKVDVTSIADALEAGEGPLFS